jgi:pimeloyl-ACP methyl ester carboxylesterase
MSGKSLEDHWKIIGRSLEAHWNIIGISLEYYWHIIGISWGCHVSMCLLWDYHGKIIGIS